MLEVIITKDLNQYLDQDIEDLFSYHTLPDCPYCKMALEEIDHAIFCDAHSFTDRCGFRLPKSKLSAGCKTALLCWLEPDRVVSCIDAGLNARDFIIRNADRGKLLLFRPDVTVSGPNKEIEVLCDGTVYRDVDSFNEGIF